MVKSREVCIALLFVGIDSENQVSLGGNLGGLGLKEIWLFVSILMETNVTFLVDQTLRTNLVSPCACCIYFHSMFCVLHILEVHI
jgi:hypothetical protein